MYDANGKLTRAGAVDVIKGGGSVLVNGKLYTNVDRLPGEAEFAKGDTAAEKAARARLQQTLRETQVQLDALEAPAGSGDANQANNEQSTDGLEEMTIVNLKELAKSINVESWGTMNKASLIAAIRAKRVEAPAGTGQQ